MIRQSVAKRVALTRTLIAALCFFVVTIGVVFFILINYISQAHASRLANQKVTDERIARLACLAVYGLPDSIGSNVASIRKAYHCPEPTPGHLSVTGASNRSTTPAPAARSAAAAAHGNTGSITVAPVAPPRATAHPGVSITTSTTHAKKPKDKPPTSNLTAAKPTPPPHSSAAATLPSVVTLPGTTPTCHVGVAGICVVQ